MALTLFFVLFVDERERRVPMRLAGGDRDPSFAFDQIGFGARSGSRPR